MAWHPNVTAPDQLGSGFRPALFGNSPRPIGRLAPREFRLAFRRGWLFSLDQPFPGVARHVALRLKDIERRLVSSTPR
jgi:hypothetical protein